MNWRGAFRWWSTEGASMFSWPMDRSPAWWRLPAGDRRWIEGGLAVGIAMVVAGIAWWHWQAFALVEAKQRLETSRQEQALALQRAAAEARAAASVPAPWWTKVPADRHGERNAAEQLSADALALGPPLAVQVLRMSMSPLPPAEAAPYRAMAVRIELRGNYPDVKRWLGELLARRPNSLGLKSLDLRRAAEGAAVPGIEASVELRLFEPVGGSQGMAGR